MAKYLICPECDDDFWGKAIGRKTICGCGYTFTEEDKRKALGLTTQEYEIVYAQERRRR